MKQSFWAYFLIIMGIVFMVIMLLIQRISTATEEDFYLGREVMEAAMIDAVDYGTYRTTGKIVMSEQKFVEVFIRRFAESVTNNKEYELSFYDIYEEPPKASVRIRTTSGTSEINSDSFEINLDVLISGILETIYGTSGEEKESTIKKVKRYIVCAGARTYNSNQVLIDDAEGGKLVTISYNADTYTSESAGVNAACDYNLDKKLNPTIDQKYCKVNYGGKTVYVLRGSLMVDNPDCNVRTLVYNLEGKSSDCKENLIANYNSKWGDLCSPRRSGYKFVGWYTKPNGGGTKIDGSEKAKTDLQVYANWIPGESTITYNSNGGSSCSNSIVSTGETIKTLCKTTKTGYIFDNWTNCANKNQIVTTSTKINENMNLCADWKTASYTLKFDTNGGLGSCKPITLAYNSNYDLSCTPTKSGSTFLGWYTSAEGGTKATTSDKITQNVTLYAHWEGACSKENYTACPIRKTCKAWGYVWLYLDPNGNVSHGTVHNEEFYVTGDLNTPQYQYIIFKNGNKRYIWGGCIANSDGSCSGTCKG